MTSLILKLIAVVTMITDHVAACLYVTKHLPYGTLYTALRALGRVAFPLYGFMLAVGAMHTKNKKQYILRMVGTLILAEAPFDMAVFAQDPLSKAAFLHQNVYFTLLFGLLTVFVMQWAFRQEGKKKVPAVLLWAAFTAAAAYLCENVLYTDYGAAGILMIAVFGILALPLQKLRQTVANERLLNTVVSALAIFVLILFTNPLEEYALFALIPIALYNGRKGYSSRAVQYGFYAVYPLHLLILALLFVLPFLKLHAALLPPL